MLGTSSLLFFLASVLLAAPPSQSDIKQALESTYEEVTYQKSLPSSSEQQVKSERRKRSKPNLEVRQFGLPNGLSSLVSALLWVGFAVVVVLTIVAIASSFKGANGKSGDTSVARGVPDADAAVVTKPLLDAERLAAEGRYADAIHALLLRTLEELKRRSSELIPISFTSREVVDSVGLPDIARGELAGLVEAVEISLFGGRAVEQPHYEQCLARFRRFADAFGGRR